MQIYDFKSIKGNNYPIIFSNFYKVLLDTLSFGIWNLFKRVELYGGLATPDKTSCEWLTASEPVSLKMRPSLQIEDSLIIYEKYKSDM